MPDTQSAPSTASNNLGRGAFTQVPIEITVSVGRARPLVRDLLRLQRDGQARHEDRAHQADGGGEADDVAVTAPHNAPSSA